MKGICITGANPLDLQLVLGAIEQSGAKPAKHAKHEEPIDINFWHEQVIAAAAEDFDVPQAISSVISKATAPNAGQAGCQPKASPVPAKAGTSKAETMMPRPVPP